MANLIRAFPDLLNFQVKNLYLAMANVPDAIEWAGDHGLLTRVMIREDGHCVGRNEMHLKNKAGVDNNQFHHFVEHVRLVYPDAAN